MTGLTAAQVAAVGVLLGQWEVAQDHSWTPTSSRVLRVIAGGGEFIVKAGRPENHHIRREIEAHSSWTGPLVAAGLTAPAVGWDEAANVLVLHYQHGVDSEGTPAETSPDFHRQAGWALRLLHDSGSRSDSTHLARMYAKCTALLDRPHRIDARVADAARGVLASAPTHPVRLVPTHGDWQPRNWLNYGGQLRVIDFGRFEFRPASSDLCRLTEQQWRDAPDAEAAFVDGYGGDPRAGASWPVALLCEAVSTAVWAHAQGDDDFEEHGIRCIERALARTAL